jgi:hypothetical protein
MDLTRDALQYIVGLEKAEIIEVNGQKYSTRNISHVKQPSPAPLTIVTLTGLIDYIKKNIDALEYKDILIQVCSPHDVKLYSCIHDDASRDCFVEVRAQTPSIVFGNFLNIEAFNIMIQSGFIQNDDSDAILKIIGNITEENVRTTGDDGISQSVTAKVGIAKVGNVVVPNPVVLRPYRTFLEISQPASKFVFRMQDGPKAALFEADGGAWKSEAMKSIKEHLDFELVTTGIKIIS